MVRGYRNHRQKPLPGNNRQAAQASGNRTRPVAGLCAGEEVPIRFIVEKSAELGASRLCPVFTQNTNSTRINLDRMRANGVEASEQCQRLTVPAIDEPVTLARLMAGWPTDRRLLVLDETGAGQPIATALAGLQKGPDGISHECGFLTGPEGGFDKAELDALRKLDFVTAVGLGSRVLRAETAAIAALSCWQALLGGGE